MGCLSVSVWLNCLCISNPPSLSVTFSGASCMEHAKRSCLADTTRFLDSMDSSNNVSIDGSDRKNERERERKKQTVQQMRQRQICSYYLITTNIIHCHKKTSYGRNKTSGNADWSFHSSNLAAFEVHFRSYRWFCWTDIYFNQTTNGMGPGTSTVVLFYYAD